MHHFSRRQAYAEFSSIITPRIIYTWGSNQQCQMYCALWVKSELRTHFSVYISAYEIVSCEPL